jgi:hypothetical protein
MRVKRREGGGGRGREGGGGREGRGGRGGVGGGGRLFKAIHLGDE